ncbi:MAG: divergent polysaccharide deacetylase family protein [Pseudomonadota bacterium]
MPNNLVPKSRPHHRRSRRIPVFSRLTLAWLGLGAVLAAGGVGLATLGQERPQRYAVHLDAIQRLSPPRSEESLSSDAASEPQLALQQPPINSTISTGDAALSGRTPEQIGQAAAARPILAAAQRLAPAGADATGSRGGRPRIIRIPSSTRTAPIDEPASSPQDIVITIDGAPARSPEEVRADAENRLDAPADPIPGPTPDMVMAGRFGPMPRISKDGVSPSEAYAHAFSPQDDPSIALIVAGLGLNPAVTARAIDELPSAVTLAFAPYAKDLPYWTERAREQGHEILIELPMEHGAKADKAIGPAGLKTGRPAQENLKRLEWLMSRFGGYVGATNYLGARLASDSDAIRPILARLSAAGLYFFDDTGAVHRFGAPTAKGVASVSRLITPGSTDPKDDLSALETVANRDGAALGKAYLTPETLDLVLAWSNTLGDRDLTLAPASAVFAFARQADG